MCKFFIEWSIVQAALAACFVFKETEKMADALMNTYGERQTTLVKGEGAYLWDSLGRRYLDALSGIAVCGLGYSHPKVTQAINEQAATLIHCSNLFLIESQLELGALLTHISGMSNVFFSNSGAEANEAAIKIARKYGNDKGINTPKIITCNSSFHGRTMATLSATGNAKVQAGFTPLVEGFIHVDYNDIEAIKAQATADVVAVMVEPIQGEGGINVPSANYLKDIRALCDQNGWLMMLDEIQTGNGRTGKYFAYQHHNILPDVVTTAKGLGNGMPIGACLASKEAALVLQPGNHGSTFGGNPLACKVAGTVVNTLINDKVMETGAATGNEIIAAFKARLANHTLVNEIRGIGMMIGIELNVPCPDFVEKAKEKNLILNVTAGNTIRLLPPLILTQEQAQTIVETVVTLINEM